MPGLCCIHAACGGHGRTKWYLALALQHTLCPVALYFKQRLWILVGCNGFSGESVVTLHNEG